jgi:acetate kinase
LQEVDLDANRGQPRPGAVATAIKSVGLVDAVGHRVVHGGMRFTGPVVVDAAVRNSSPVGNEEEF